MARPRSKLDKKAQAGEVIERLETEPPGWKRERLLALKHGLEGEMSLEEIAEAVGRARSCIQRWFDVYRSRGLKGLLHKAHAGGVESTLKAPVAAEMKEKLKEGKWRRAADVKRWLAQEHGVEVALPTVYKYLGKCEARLKVPRPSHARKDAAAAETFKSELAAKLRELGIEMGRRVRIWVADEMRYGLQPVTRRVWSLRGTRVVVPVEPRYEWGYCYGALEVQGEGAEFFYTPTVNLECSALFLSQIGAIDPEAVHVVVWDGAGFHQQDRTPEVPANVRLLKLPAYSPELNPIEKLWDIAKDAICNRVFGTVQELETILTGVFAQYWSDAKRVRDLIGTKGWLVAQANATSPSVLLIS
ncbi:MAG: IS630 family transposase [Verrucomicrobiota bacterium]